jgi:subtilisin family serine protease
MNKNKIIAMGMIVLIFLSVLLVDVEAKRDKITGAKIYKESHKRMVAINESQYAEAEFLGCDMIKDNGKFRVYSCKNDVSDSTSLYEDIKVYPLNEPANTAVEADYAHSLGYSGKGVKIALIDSGYDYNHIELSSSYGGGYDFIDNDDDPMDVYGHGTKVAGMIVSDGINSTSKGIAPDAEIIALRVLNSNGEGSLSDVSDAIYYAVEHYDIDVISISLGSSSSYQEYCDSEMPYFVDAINYAHSRGVSVVAASGNSIQNVTAPGCVSNVISVGRTDINLMASSSYYNPIIDIYAPALNLLTTFPGNSYGTSSGSSISTPLVSGAIALLKEKNPSLEYSEAEGYILDNAKEFSYYGYMNYKALDVGAAIDAVPEPVLCNQPSLSYSLVNGEFIVSWQSQTGCSYNLRESTDLSTGNWMSIGIFNGNDGVIEHRMYPDGNMRFFRIEVI